MHVEFSNWVVLFDLENCLIRHWDDAHIINVEAIQGFLSHLLEHDYSYTYGIYSYALWREENRDIVINKLLPQLEDNLNIEFEEDYIFGMGDIVRDFSSKHGNIDYRAYCSVVSKEYSLMEFQKNNPKFYRCSIVLVDPTVVNGLSVFDPRGNTMLFINSNELENFKIAGN